MTSEDGLESSSILFLRVRGEMEMGTHQLLKSTETKQQIDWDDSAATEALTYIISIDPFLIPDELR